MGMKKVNGMEIRWTLSSIQVVAISEWGELVLAQYEYGRDYLLNEKTGSMHFTWKPFQVVEDIVSSTKGLQDIPDDYQRCAVCDSPCTDRLCSNDCAMQEREASE